MASTFEQLELQLSAIREGLGCDWLHLADDMSPAEIAKVRKLALECANDLSAFAGYLYELPPKPKRSRLTIWSK